MKIIIMQICFCLLREVFSDSIFIFEQTSIYKRSSNVEHFKQFVHNVKPITESSLDKDLNTINKLNKMKTEKNNCSIDSIVATIDSIDATIVDHKGKIHEIANKTYKVNNEKIIDSSNNSSTVHQVIIENNKTQAQDKSLLNFTGFFAMGAIYGLLFVCLLFLWLQQSREIQETQTPLENQEHASNTITQPPPSYDHLFVIDDFELGSQQANIFNINEINHTHNLSSRSYDFTSPERPPNYFHLLRDWASKGKFVNRSSIQSPPPTYSSFAGSYRKYSGSYE